MKTNQFGIIGVGGHHHAQIAVIRAVENIENVIIVKTSEDIPTANFALPIKANYLEEIKPEILPEQGPFYGSRSRRGKRKYHGKNKF